jgi:hypothetical protein
MNTATHQETLENSSHPPFPKVLSYVGFVWIVYGATNLVGATLSLAQLSVGPFPNGEVLTQLWVCLVAGAGLAYIGVQTVRGSASDTLGNGIGSIIWGALLLYGISKSADELARLSDDVAAMAWVWGGRAGCHDDRRRARQPGGT